MISMSKKLAALSLGLFAFAAPLHAQGAAAFSLGGSLGMPLGDLDDGVNMGFHLVGAANFRPQSLPVGIQVDANFARFGTEGDGVNLRGLFATGNAVYSFSTAETSSIRPYLIGGLGVYNLKFTGDGVSDDGTTKLGINAGAGFNFAAGNTALFVEGRFHNVFTENSSAQFIPLTVGIRFGGL